MDVRAVPYSHPDATKLIEAVQQEYVTRYGDPDVTPVDPAEFAPPSGVFLIGYVGAEPAVCGGWRVHDEPVAPLAVGDAEMKRLFVVPSRRGNGLARGMLAELERSAAEAGKTRMVLETGVKQPEALALYYAEGYERIPQFGVYAGDPLSVCLAKPL
ncbi:GNAT family N-acetyltransferase [Saccharomonospora piscinae]|uniref:GNAT family N-acetyltransferase n=1 Tax=Saccharomonospora piscinae TaxID=687388 RepID=UPI000463A8D1|nr:GNAT family N-acetyltransferase [Saccharomonospora piscinae]